MQKKRCHKKRLKIKDYRSCLKATQIENKISQLEKNKVNLDSLKNFIKINKVI